MKKIFSVILVFAYFLTLNVGVKADAVDCFAQAAVVISCDTGSVLYSKNSDVKLPMASTTKIMTALLLIEQNTPNREITVTKEMVAVEGSSMGLCVGDIVTFSDLLYGLMLPSGNDAANTVAIAVSGSTEKFAELMNKKACELGLKNTHFATPSGLDGKNHGTTAYELAVISRYAMQYDEFRKAVSAKTVTLTLKNGRKITLTNHNKLLNLYDGAIGIKTGYTSLAGRCLVSAANKNGVTLICVTLNDRNDWNDHSALLDYGFSLCRNELIDVQIPKRVYSADGLQNVKLKLANEYISVCDKDKLTFEILLPAFLYAGVEKNEQVGCVKVYCNNSFVKNLPILAENSIEKTQESSFFDKVLKNLIIIFRSL